MGLLDRVLDKSIVFSFDKTGFRRHRRDFRDADLDVDLRGRVCLVTGANSGIGDATTRALAERGATVHMLCRSHERGSRARDAIAEETGSDRLGLTLVDVSDFTSVQAAAESLAALPRVDVLVHNAGVLPDERSHTADGLELTLATNLAGPFLLTHLLWPQLRASDDGRLIHVSSGGMYSETLDVEALRNEDGDFDGVAAYARTKRAQVVLTELLAERLADDRLTVASMHPGWADTPAVRSSLPRFHAVTKAILRTPSEGADTVVWLAAAPAERLEQGRFWFDREPRSTHLLRRTEESAEERRALWRALCDWTGIDPEESFR